MDVLRSVPTNYSHNDEASVEHFLCSDDEVVPSLDHAFDIFAEYNVELHQLDQLADEDDLKTITELQDKKDVIILREDDTVNPVKPTGIDRESSGRLSNKSPADGDYVGLKFDSNHNQVDIGNSISPQIGYLRNKLIASFRPGIPNIAEDGSDLETAEDAEKHCAQISQTNAAGVSRLNGKNDNITGSVSHEKSPGMNSPSSNSASDADIIDSSLQSTCVADKSSLESRDNGTDTALSPFPSNYTPRRRHSLATIPHINVARIAVSRDEQHSVSKIHSQLETDINNVDTNCESHINGQICAEYPAVSEGTSSVPSSSDETKQRASLLTVPGPRHPRRQRRYSLADISNMGLSVLEEPSFAREIRQHQLLTVDEKKPPLSGENYDESDNADEPKTRDLTSPVERAKYLRRRRASHGAIAPILPNLHLPRSPRSSTCDIPSIDPVSPAPAIQVTTAYDVNDDDEEDKPSKLVKESDEDAMSAAEDRNRLLAARRGKRRSSWACTGSHPTMNPISTMEFLRKNNSYGDIESTSTESRDPYRLTVHFITDPGQSDKLRNLLLPLTKSVVHHLAIFNYVERSMNACTPRAEEDDSTTIPALGIVVFLQEEVGAERLTNAQGYLQEEPWALHHRSELGPNAVPYPTNNQDFYAHTDDMPLWAVRQVHFGKDRLRCQLFVTDEHWNNTIQLYATILGHSVQYLKDDFCYFQVYSNTKRNLEIQLSLKKLPVGYKAGPLDDAILQFKIDDIGALVPLLPNVCSPISHKRWQTTDFDGNKILLYRPNKPRCFSPRHDDSDGSVSTTSDNEIPHDKHRRGRHHRHHKRKSKIISTAV